MGCGFLPANTGAECVLFKSKSTRSSERIRCVIATIYSVLWSGRSTGFCIEKEVATSKSSLSFCCRVKCAAAFNHYASSAQVVVVVVSFAFAPHTAGLFALLSVLVALAFRDEGKKRDSLKHFF